jgi:two-component system, OmpR family, bacitracin resistance sensor histidine kinase BceS
MNTTLKEHKWWVGFAIIINVCLNTLLLLDSGLANVSIIYFNLLYGVLFILFLIFLYKKDQKVLIENDFQQLSPVQQKIADYYSNELLELKHAHILLRSNYAEKDDELLAWVHEMKSPLTAMKLMLDQLDSDDRRKGKLEKEWLRLYLLLDQQLHTTRILTIEQDSKIEPLSLRLAVIEEIKSFQPWCMEKGIGFELDELNEEVTSDKKWLCFIIRQYISNAVKYSQENNVIEVKTSYSPQGHLLLKVRDYGKGIATQDLPRVFKKSYTGSTGRESSVASGMGLYLAKQAADSLGLKLYLHSEVGVGTTAVIQFPLTNEYNKMGM